MTGFDVSFTFDDALREVPASPADMRRAVEWLEIVATDPARPAPERARAFGLIGTYARILGDLPRARTALTESLAMYTALGEARAAFIQDVRLAHVLQWERDFAASDRAYAVLIGRAEREEVLVGLLDTVLQHAGKNAFDQARYDEARSLFERALVLRESKGELDLTVSTRQALEATRRRQAAG